VACAKLQGLETAGRDSRKSLFSRVRQKEGGGRGGYSRAIARADVPINSVITSMKGSLFPGTTKNIFLVAIYMFPVELGDEAPAADLKSVGLQGLHHVRLEP